MTAAIEHIPVGLDPRFVVDLKGRMEIDPRFVVHLKGGNPFPTYAGVLDMASRSGLKALTTEIVQIPTSENGGMAIVAATAVFEDGRVFTDIGDASPASVKPLMVPAVLRMASTRAKGRVLRDAMNIGQALLEELGDDDGSPAERARMTEKAPHRPAVTPGKAAAQTAPESAPGSPKANRAQIEAKYAEWLEKAARLGALQHDASTFHQLRNVDLSEMDPVALKERCAQLKRLVEHLEALNAEHREAKLDLAMDAAAEADPDPFDGQ